MTAFGHLLSLAHPASSTSEPSATPSAANVRDRMTPVPLPALTMPRGDGGIKGYADAGWSIDDAALLKEQGDESTAGGEELHDRADFRIGQVPADKAEDGAQPGIARRLAETGEQVGKVSHCGSFRA